MQLIQGYIGTQPVVSDYVASKLVSAVNYRVHALVVVNKNAATVFVQIFDQVGTDTTQSLDGSNIPRYEVPVASGDIMTLQHSQFFRGLFVQAVTVQGSKGTNVLASTDLKITAEGLVWPASPT